MSVFTKSFEIRGKSIADIKTDIEAEIDAHVAAFDNLVTADYPWEYQYNFATISLLIKAEVYAGSTGSTVFNTWRCILTEDTGYSTIDVTLKFIIADFLTAIDNMIAGSNNSNIGILTGRCRIALDYTRVPLPV